MHQLLGRNRQAVERQLARAPRFEPADEIRAVDVRKQQSFLNHHRRRREDRLVLLRFANRRAHDLPAAGKLRGEVARAAGHDEDLLVRRLALDHRLHRGRSIVVARDMLERIEIDVLILKRMHQLVHDRDARRTPPARPSTT